MGERCITSYGILRATERGFLSVSTESVSSVDRAATCVLLIVVISPPPPTAPTSLSAPRTASQEIRGRYQHRATLQR